MLNNQQRLFSTLMYTFLLVSPITQADVDHDFRVSGIMRIGEKSSQMLGLLEFTNGEIRTVREGDTIAAWKVTGFSGDCIELSQPGKPGNKRCLTDSSAPPVMTTEPPAPTTPALSATDRALAYQQDHFKKIDKAEFLQILDRFVSAKNMTKVSEQIMSLIMLPAENQITEIDAQAVTSTQNAIALMRNSVEDGRPIRLTLNNPNTHMDVVYLQVSGNQNP